MKSFQDWFNSRVEPAAHLLSRMRPDARKLMQDVMKLSWDAAMDAQAAEIAKLKGLLKECQWADEHLNCYFCFNHKRQGHAPDCRLAAAIQDAKEK